MKKILWITVLFLVFGFVRQTGVYDFSITTPDGNELSLNAFGGKKLMLVVLPSTTTSADSALLQQLSTLNASYKDNVTMIGIPSYEDGFEDEDASYLHEFYQTYLNEGFVIAGGMYTHKPSGQQAPLFGYLTHASQNGYFDEDVSGVGEKFFINVEGTFTGISAAGAEFNEEIFRNMINN
jgi:glutathione peroxidase-family protein